MNEPHAGVTERSRGLVGAYRRHRQAVLFYSLLLTLAANPALSALKLNANLLQLFLAFNLFAAVLGGDPRRRWGPLLLIAGALLAHGVAQWFHTAALSTAAYALWTVLAMLAAAGALRFAMRATAVDPEHLYAALSAYLLAAFFFGVLYWAIERGWPGSFLAGGAVMAGGEFTLARGIYFSFVTVATLGYGDLVPGTELAQGLAVLEAVAGQLYLAVMIARLVSLYGRSGSTPE